MYNIQSIIDYFLSKEEMTPKKLQKLLYYAYSWHLVFENESSDELSERLFSERFQAWVHGPVVPAIYHQYKEYGGSPIPRVEDFNLESANFTDETKDVLNQVWEIYGGYNGNELESISHQEKPWLEARGGCSPIELCQTEINDETIFETYGSRL
ncbi:Panacea domain-containing protein [Exiguobacterium aestuarii]|uniref:Panacea domain-containing protein n=1 Tax=Exiguobacterium aestuarii TaxID=273527 RepID=A0ABW2PMH1_9BACL|nr:MULTISPECIES: type II toxin-antitoxin system antitoxin SocA domain-containing protein [Exiguobacterium]MCT4785708.1 DUF4065 domain-containing protein [Exiguobacterium aestuarii]